MVLPWNAPPRSAAAAVAVDMPAGSLRQILLTSALAAAFSLWAGGVLSQEAPAQPEDPAQPSGDTAQAGGAQPSPGDASDPLLATVGGSEIRSSDLLRAIGALPPPVSAQPPEIVAALALQQLLLREAIVQQARSQGLAEDPEVQSLVEQATRAAEEDALAQVWLERELASRVTPEAVDQAYAGLQAIATGEVPPLEQLRPQIEQGLRQQALESIQTSLLSGAGITLYGPDGQPRATGAAGQGQAGAQEQGDGQAPDGGAAAGQAGGEAQPSQGQGAQPEEGDQSGAAGADPAPSTTGGAADQGSAPEQSPQAGD